MARQASKKESTEAAVDQGARTFGASKAASDALSAQIADKEATILVDVDRDALDKGWKAVQEDWNEIKADKDLTSEERAAHVVDAVTPFLRLANRIEGPGVASLTEALALARKVDGYRVRALRLMATAGADRHQIAAASGLTLARASQYVAAASLRGMVRGTGLTLSDGQAETIVARGQIKAAKAAIKAKDKDALTLCHTPAEDAAPKVDGGQDDAPGVPASVSHAMVLESAAEDFLAAVRASGNLAPSDLSTLDSACAKAAKALEVLQARRASVRAVAAATAAA